MHHGRAVLQARVNRAFLLFELSLLFVVDGLVLLRGPLRYGWVVGVVGAAVRQKISALFQFHRNLAQPSVIVGIGGGIHYCVVVASVIKRFVKRRGDVIVTVEGSPPGCGRNGVLFRIVLV